MLIVNICEMSELSMRYGKSNRNSYINKRLWLVLPLVLFISMVVIGTVKVIGIISNYNQSVNVYENIAQAALTISEESLPKDTEETILILDEYGNTQVLEHEDTDKVKERLSVDFDMLKAINEDVCMWIISDDGRINYPVVQGSDNEYYIDHLFNGNENDSGAIFIDFRNSSDLSDKNTFVFGHNMRDGSMFGRLEEMGVTGFRIITPVKTYKLTAFAGYVVPGDSDIYQIAFSDDEDFGRYIERIRLMSEFDSGVAVNNEDKIITLSTCNYDFNDARYVLHLKLEIDDNKGDLVDE